MRILNCMFGRNRGGLEQAALDYHEALALAGCNVTSVVHAKANIVEHFKAAQLDYSTLHPIAEWDMLSALKLRALAKSQQADLIIAHGNRAISLALRACKGHIPVVGVAHNYKIKKRFPKCDAVFCITRDLIEECVHLDIPRNALFHIPNLIRIGDTPPARSPFSSPITIGTLGRFVEKKGMDVLLQAISALHQQGYEVQAIIGGDGEQAPALQQQAKQLGIEQHVRFAGWVQDKAALFEQLDIFVLPSHHEPFGIVLIEAMAAGLPCITTDTEGPCEIVSPPTDAIMIPKAKPYAMAQAIAQLIDNPQVTLQMGCAAYQTAHKRYDIHVVSKQLHEAAQMVVQQASR